MSKITEQAKQIFDQDLDEAEKVILARWKQLHSKKAKLKSLFQILKK